MEIERMLYRRYKTSYADCETVVGSKALTENQVAEKARLENWWMRYHKADAETRRLMACGAIV